MEWDCAAGDGLLKSIGTAGAKPSKQDFPLVLQLNELRVGGLWASRFHPID